MKKYELVFVLGEGNTEDRAKEIAKEVKQNLEKKGGKIEKDFFWGKKKLAYKIGKNSFGYYFIFVFDSEPEIITKLNKDLNLDEKIIRYLITAYVDDPAFWEGGGEKEIKFQAKRKKIRKEIEEKKESSALFKKEDKDVEKEEEKIEEQEEIVKEEKEKIIEEEKAEETKQIAEEIAKKKEEKKEEKPQKLPEKEKEISIEERQEELDKKLAELLKEE